MAFISLTTVTLNSIFHLPAFWYHASKSYRACMRSDGIMETKLDSRKITYATMTLWSDTSSMLKFIAHPAHVKAMKWSKGRTHGRTYHYESSALPNWADANDLLQRLGKQV